MTNRCLYSLRNSFSILPSPMTGHCTYSHSTRMVLWDSPLLKPFCPSKLIWTGITLFEWTAKWKKRSRRNRIIICTCATFLQFPTLPIMWVYKCSMASTLIFFQILTQSHIYDVSIKEKKSIQQDILGCVFLYKCFLSKSYMFSRSLFSHLYRGFVRLQLLAVLYVKVGW